MPHCRRQVEVVVHADALAVGACAADGVQLLRELGRDARMVVVRRPAAATSSGRCS